LIDAVDSALEKLLKRELGRGADVSFDPPAKDWVGRERKRALLDVHLIEVREDPALRAGGLELSPPTENGGARTRRPAPRWFRLSYWISAWGPDAAAEHGALAQALAALARYEALPADVLDGDLARLGLPVRMEVGMPPAGDAHVATVWASLGVPLRAAVALDVTAPLEVPPAVEAGPPVVERRLRMHPPKPPPPPGKQVPPGMPAALAAPPAPAPAPGAEAKPADAKAADKADGKAADKADGKAADKAAAAKPAEKPAAAEPAPEPPAPVIEELLIAPDPDVPPRRIEPDSG
jgi:hypothetical protein